MPGYNIFYLFYQSCVVALNRSVNIYTVINYNIINDKQKTNQKFQQLFSKKNKKGGN